MSNVNWDDIRVYDWVPFFRELVNKLVAIGKQSNRDAVLMNKCSKCFKSTDAILKYDEVDPMSFIYFLAQKNTVNQRASIYSSVKQEFSISAAIPTDWVFPTPTPNTTTLYHDGINFLTDDLWSFFNACAENQDIPPQLFEKVLQIKNVGLRKVTQTLFLINSYRFLPYDPRLLTIPGTHAVPVAGSGKDMTLSLYQEYLKQMKELFPGCEYYEINFFGSLLYSGTIRISGRFYQIGSNAYDDGKDYHERFHSENAVWVGGPRSGHQGKIEYNLTEPKAGDVILPHFSTTGNGVGVIIDNQYANNGGYQDELAFKVVWINKESKPDAVNSKQSVGFSRANSIKDSFKIKYEETFRMLENLSLTGHERARIEGDTVKNLILQGPPGSGKTRLAKQLALYLKDENASLVDFLTDNSALNTHEAFKADPRINENGDQVKIVQFHPGYTYEDFVRGITTSVENGAVQYYVSDRILMDMVNRAVSEPSRPFVLIIDEMNRANLPSVLGELIYALEYRDEPVSSVYAKETSGSDVDPRDITIPNNLYIIGTMNTADRSIGHIDYAIRRRFVFRSVPSDISVISSDVGKELYNKVSEIFDGDYLSPDLTKSDVMVGHSYFMGSAEELSRRLELEIKPLLREYVRDGILIGSDVSERIEELSVE